MQYIREHLRYPKDSIHGTVTGRVLVGFVVNEDGSLSDVKVMKGLTPVMDEEAIRVVKSMPKWKPGQQVIDNLIWLSTHAKHKDRIVIRIPLIPQFNTPENQKRSQQALEELGFVNFDVFEYIVRA